VEELDVESKNDLLDYDIRSKVFIKLLESIDDFDSNRYHFESDKILKRAEEEGMNISLFKKNQVGGVREIYILRFMLRLSVKLLEDYSRTIVSAIHQKF
jgi:hypothetical protein